MRKRDGGDRGGWMDEGVGRRITNRIRRRTRTKRMRRKKRRKRRRRRGRRRTSANPECINDAAIHPPVPRSLLRSPYKHSFSQPETPS